MSTTAIISQVVNGIGSIINMIGINIKDKRKVLLFFIAGNTCVATALGLLNARSGMIVQIIFVIESIINYFWEKEHDKYPTWLILLYVIIPCTILVITYQSAWDLLPILASFLFPLALISKEFKLRLLNLLSIALWIPYNFYFGQYAGAITCIMFTIMNMWAIVRFDILKSKFQDNKMKEK